MDSLPDLDCKSFFAACGKNVFLFFQTSIHILLELADSAVLPYNLQKFPKAMKDAMEAFEKNNITQKLEDNNASLKFVQSAIEEFEMATSKFMAKLNNVKQSHNPMELRIINDQIMHLERVFLMPSGLPGRPDSRNAIFAPGKFNSYEGGAFPGISDLLHEIDDLDDIPKAARWKEIRRHVSDLMIMIQEATRFLNPVEQI